MLGKYKMVKVALGDIDTDVHSANQNKDNANPGVSDFPPAPVLTVATAALTEREPEIAELMGNVSFDVDVLSSILAWQEENSASAEEAAVYFLTSQSDTWSGWINDDARAKLSKFIQ